MIESERNKPTAQQDENKDALVLPPVARRARANSRQILDEKMKGKGLEPAFDSLSEFKSKRLYTIFFIRCRASVPHAWRMRKPSSSSRM